MTTVQKCLICDEADDLCVSQFGNALCSAHLGFIAVNEAPELYEAAPFTGPANVVEWAACSMDDRAYADGSWIVEYCQRASMMAETAHLERRMRALRGRRAPVQYSPSAPVAELTPVSL